MVKSKLQCVHWASGRDTHPQMIVAGHRKLGITAQMNTRELPNGSSIFIPSLKS